MFMKYLSSVLIFLLIGQTFVLFAQEVDNAEDKTAAVRKNAAGLLRETAILTASLNSPSNRIGFTAAIADLLWELDKTEAKSMYKTAVDDVGKMVLQVDAEMNFAEDSTVRRNSYSKVNQVLSWRSIVINSLANRDSEWALRFLNETNQFVTNPQFRKSIERSDKNLTSALARKIAEQDVTKALEFGRETLSKGFSNDVVNIMQKIYAKDTEKGIEFGGEVVKKLDSTKLNRNSLWLVVRLFEYGFAVSANNGKQPLFTDDSMKKLAETIAAEVIKPTNNYRGFSPNAMKGLEKYAPQNVLQVKTVFEQRKTTGRNNRSSLRTESAGKTNLTEKSRQNIVNSQNELRNNIQRINIEEITIEEKRKILNDVQYEIMSNSNESWRFTNLISLAAAAKNIGETKKALEILDEAERLINRDPKIKIEYSDNRNLADAYAEIEAEKSFQILENMIYRLNGVIDGYIKFMEYSANQRSVENGELVINNNSGQFTNYISLSPSALQTLAEKDFNRLRDVSDKFERPEVRIATRLIFARALLNPNQKKSITFSSGVNRINGRL